MRTADRWFNTLCVLVATGSMLAWLLEHTETVRHELRNTLDCPCETVYRTPSYR